MATAYPPDHRCTRPVSTGRPARRLSKSRGRRHSPIVGPPSVAVTALEFSQEILHGPVLKRHLGVHTLELLVFLLDLFQALDIRRLHATVFARSLIERGIADAVLSADICDLATSLGLLQQRHDPCLREFGIPYCVSSIATSWQKTQLTHCAISGEAYVREHLI